MFHLDAVEHGLGLVEAQGAQVEDGDVDKSLVETIFALAILDVDGVA